jgi:hypothetical protein
MTSYETAPSKTCQRRIFLSSTGQSHVFRDLFASTVSFALTQNAISSGSSVAFSKKASAPSSSARDFAGSRV